MKKILLLIFVIANYGINFCQTFTVEQNVTGQNGLMDIRGQSFTPSIQGVGSGDVGTDDTVYLDRISIIYAFSAPSEADTLYIYSAIPDSTVKIDSVTGGNVIGKSIIKQDGEFPYTDYIFNWVPMHKDSTYYAVFRQDVNLEAGAASSYPGGGTIRNRADTLQLSDILDLKFVAGFSPVPSNATKIISFSVGSQVGTSIINSEEHTVTAVIENYASLDFVSTTIEVSEGASYMPDNNYIDYSAGPVTFTITAEDGITTRDWIVTVTKTPSIEADILSFSLPEQTGDAVIITGDKEVEIEVEYGTDLINLTPTITISEGASISPASETPVDFSSGQAIYTVTAEDTTVKVSWTVTVTVKSNGVSIADLNQLSDIFLYPVFCNNIININQDNNENLHISIYDIQGIHVKTTIVCDKTNTLDVSGLHNGIYHVVVERSEKRYVFRILKQEHSYAN